MWLGSQSSLSQHMSTEVPTSCTSDMFGDLQLPALRQRRTCMRLCAVYGMRVPVKLTSMRRHGSDASRCNMPSTC